MTNPHGAVCMGTVGRHFTGVAVGLVQNKHRLGHTGVRAVITDLDGVALLCRQRALYRGDAFEDGGGDGGCQALGDTHRVHLCHVKKKINKPCTM